VPLVRAPSAAASRVRVTFDPVDVTLRRARIYQRVRRAVLGASVLAVVATPVVAAHLARAGAAWAPVTGAPGAMRVLGVEFLDPLLVAGVAVAHGPSWTLLLAALPVLALVVFLGRFFCGWVCPYLPLLALSNAVRWALGRFGFRPLDLRLPPRVRYLVLAAVLVGTALCGFQLAPLVYPPLILGRTAFRLAMGWGPGGATLALGAVLLFDTFVSRAGFCRSLCPGGALFSLLGWASPVRVRRRPSACTDCTVCDVVCHLGQSPMRDRLDAGCERCGRCLSACPTGALSIGLGKPQR
jgi:ferredoxin-type protein NapH